MNAGTGARGAMLAGQSMTGEERERLAGTAFCLGAPADAAVAMTEAEGNREIARLLLAAGITAESTRELAAALGPEQGRGYTELAGLMDEVKALYCAEELAKLRAQLGGCQ